MFIDIPDDFRGEILINEKKYIINNKEINIPLIKGWNNLEIIVYTIKDFKKLTKKERSELVPLKMEIKEMDFSSIKKFRAAYLPIKVVTENVFYKNLEKEESIACFINGILYTNKRPYNKIYEYVQEVNQEDNKEIAIKIVMKIKEKNNSTPFLNEYTIYAR
jgi:hypothetical protein